MFDVVSKLLLTRQLKFEKGNIELLQQKVCIFPLRGWYLLQKNLQQNNLDNMIYYVFKWLAGDWWKNMANIYKMKNMQEFIEWGLKILTLSGHGHIKLVSMDSKLKATRYMVEGSVIAKEFGKTGKAVDQVFRGLIAGTNEFIYHVPSEAIEIKCLSKSDSYCEFISKPTKDFDMSKKEVKKQLFIPKNISLSKKNIN